MCLPYPLSLGGDDNFQLHSCVTLWIFLCKLKRESKMALSNCFVYFFLNQVLHSIWKRMGNRFPSLGKKKKQHFNYIKSGYHVFQSHSNDLLANFFFNTFSTVPLFIFYMNFVSPSLLFWVFFCLMFYCPSLGTI